MRRIILSIAAAAVVATGLVGATPANAYWPYYGYNNWRAHEWREHEYWAWRHHFWWQAHHSWYSQPDGYWYR
jgi:hypothetical protein